MFDNHYLFEDAESGELFLVGAPKSSKALEIAQEYFDNPVFIRKVSEFEAENSGLDEY